MNIIVSFWRFYRLIVVIGNHDFAAADGFVHGENADPVLARHGSLKAFCEVGAIDEGIVVYDHGIARLQVLRLFRKLEADPILAAVAYILFNKNPIPFRTGYVDVSDPGQHEISEEKVNQRFTVDFGAGKNRAGILQNQISLPVLFNVIDITLKQGVHINIQQIRKLRDDRNVGYGETSFPFGNGLIRDAHGQSQLMLGVSFDAAQGSDRFADFSGVHLITSNKCGKAWKASHK